MKIKLHISPSDLPRSPFRWVVGVVALLVILILGIVALASLGHKPTSANVTPTATRTPQERVVIQLVDVLCATTENYLGSDTFSLTSDFSATVIGGTTHKQTQTTTAFAINDKQTRGFPASEQIIFDGNLPPKGTITGTLTTYNGTDQLGKTTLTIPAVGMPTQEETWPFSQSGFTYWDYTLHYLISRTSVAAVPAAGAVVLAWSPDAAYRQRAAW